MWIFYKCKCLAQERFLEVPDRRDGQDVLQFMEAAQDALTIDHRKISPHCLEPAVEYAKIPYDNPVKGIGYPATKQ